MQQATVIACQSEAEFNKAREWRRATGAKHGVTYVVFSTVKGAQIWEDQPSAEWKDVFIDGPRGPITSGAWIFGRGQ